VINESPVLAAVRFLTAWVLTALTAVGMFMAVFMFFVVVYGAANVAIAMFHVMRPYIESPLFSWASFGFFTFLIARAATARADKKRRHEREFKSGEAPPFR
jgi:hypothetical protein